MQAKMVDPLLCNWGHYGVRISFKISAKISAVNSAVRPAVSAEPAVSFTMATRFGAQQQKR